MLEQPERGLDHGVLAFRIVWEAQGMPVAKGYQEGPRRADFLGHQAQ